MRTDSIIPRMLGVLLCWVAGTAWLFAQGVDPATSRAREHGPSPEVRTEQTSPRVEIYRLRIVNDGGGVIAGSRDAGKTWQPIGHVMAYTKKVAKDGYTASKWAPMSAVSATAVNAIHIRTGYNAKDDRGVVFSLLPAEILTEMGKKLQSFFSPDSSIYTDIPGGTGIFGGDWAPILGNPVLRDTPDGLVPLPENYVPQQGDVFVIRVMQPTDSPQGYIFENRFGGLITELGWDGKERAIGQVLKPVEGVGRFTGSQYSDVGRLRANHNGVICISVSPKGSIGGFQIIPREHAMSPEMIRARTMTQWMVIGPLDARDPSWEGVAPLFLGYLRPSWAPDDWASPDWLRRVTSRVLVDVRVKGGPWQGIPQFTFDADLTKPLPERCMTFLSDITHIRILLPVPEKGVG